MSEPIGRVRPVCVDLLGGNVFDFPARGFSSSGHSIFKGIHTALPQIEVRNFSIKEDEFPGAFPLALDVPLTGWSGGTRSGTRRIRRVRDTQRT